MIKTSLKIVAFLLFTLSAAGLFSSCGGTSTAYNNENRQNIYDQYMDMPGQEAGAFARPIVFIPGDESEF